MKFISYYPLKQGLKLYRIGWEGWSGGIYILLSIKTRIETSLSHPLHLTTVFIYILLSIKTRIETKNKVVNLFPVADLYPTIH